MRICPYCHKDIDETVDKCPYCGKDMITVDEQLIDDTDIEFKTDNVNDESDNGNKAIGYYKNNTAAGMTLIIIAIVLLIIIGLFSKPNVDLNDYITINVTGYDTVGEAETVFDYSAMKSDLGKKLSWNENEISKHIEDEYWWHELINTNEDPEDQLSNIISEAIVVSQTSNISNGDTITVSLNLSEDEIKYLGKIMKCRIQFNNIEYIVSDLEVLDSYDPFDDVSISFSGTDGHGALIVDKSDNEILDILEFTVDNNGSLSNGDQITVCVDVDQTEVASKYNVIVSPQSSSYVVNGLLDAITSIDEISDSVLSNLQNISEDEIDEFMELNFDILYDADISYQFLGNYLLLDNTDNASDLYMIYLVSVNTDSIFMSLDGTSNVNYYLGVEFSAVGFSDDGEISYFDVDIQDQDHFYIGMYPIYGYETLDELYDELIECQLNSNITVELSVVDIEEDKDFTEDEESKDDELTESEEEFEYDEDDINALMDIIGGIDEDEVETYSQIENELIDFWEELFSLFDQNELID